ncbi:MAG TPA: hypothetical protein VNW29_02915 [Candidatus Sulfotelmatobacter sp.]|jgi:hypothetical protein|nr:hypothetical protein [Candidatus Sulfotelmatobacter sp.]
MEAKNDIPKLPRFIKVDVKKSLTGNLIADLPDLDIFTEANDLNELFINVNDLIYTFYDIPKKYHDQIRFIPSDATIQELVAISREERVNNLSQFKVNTFYAGDLHKSITL